MEKLLAPIKSIRARYIPLLTIYFTVGLAGISSVTNVFFFKNSISLAASDLVSLSIWIGLPWSIKMVFGTLIDGLPLFGSNRKSYIILGNILIILGTVGMVDHASTRILFSHLGEYLGLLLTGLLTTNGVVISDIVADTMAIEMVEDGPNRDKDLGMVQVLSRMSLALGGLIGALMTGYAATHLDPHMVYASTLILPLQCILVTLFIKLPRIVSSSVNWKIFVGGVLYGLVCILSGMFLGDYSQLVVFLVAMVVLIMMMHSILGDMAADAVKPFIMAMIAIFLFRTVPGVGPAGQWFYIEKLGFDANFLGTLSIVAACCSLAALWFLADSITNHSIFKTMGLLTGLITVLSLPDILIYYNLHTVLGVPAKALVLVDTAAIVPMAQLSMIPLGVLIARNAPERSRAVYISLTASLMNIALVGGDIITKKLNEIFIITRTDFSELGYLMISSLSISTAMSIIGLVLLWRTKS